MKFKYILGFICLSPFARNFFRHRWRCTRRNLYRRSSRRPSFFYSQCFLANSSLLIHDIGCVKCSTCRFTRDIIRESKDSKSRDTRAIFRCGETRETLHKASKYIFSFEVYCSLGRNNRAEAHNAQLRELHIKE